MTMGALHAGHLSLVGRSTVENDVTVVTIYVNPTQFRPGEDFEEYPRDQASDLAALADFPVDFVFAPDENSMYSANHSTFVEPPRIAEPLEGRCRPGHFRGVATIVLKLLNIIQPTWPILGKKTFSRQ